MALQKLCVKRIAESIDLYSSAYSSVESENLKRGFYLLQKIFSDELISYLISKRLLREQHANLVFNEYLKSIDTEWFATYSWSKIVEIFQRIGPNLEKITFNEEYRKDVSYKDVICHLPHVKVIIYRERCNDAILQRIAAYCPRIETLDVIRSRHVTDAGLKHFCLLKRGKKRDGEGECLTQKEKVPCPLLKEMLLKCTSVKGEGIEVLLKNLDSLERIDCIKLPLILYRMHKENASSLEKIQRITHLDLSWFERQDSYEDILEFCATVCRNLKSFICPIYRLEHLNLCSKLPDFVNLDLDIHSGEVANTEINDFLQNEGGKLSSLTLRECNVSLSVLAQCCPRLYRLDITSVSIQYDEKDDVPRLNNLTVFAVRDVDLTDSADCRGICRILSSSPALNRLCFEWCDSFPTEIKMEILRCCQQCPLKHIEFSESSVSVEFLQDILLTCPTLEVLTLAELDDLSDELKQHLYSIAETLPNRPEIDF